jgi:phenylalanyl-tRNA synthetase beta chain
MKVLLSWLNDLAPLGDDVDALAEAMNALGLAVDGIDHAGLPVPGVVVAKVVRTQRHPDAAKVHRVYVDTGDGREHHVWCGAFNMAPGDLVPLATLGTTMPDGREILRRGILGIDSEGMLCSGRELGLGDDHTGILILPPGLALGADVFEALGIRPDTVFELDLTRNRPDCWGHLGVARDLAAHLGVALTRPGGPLVPSGPERSVPVEIADGDACGRFTVTVMSGVRVGPSQPWLAERLARAGMRPINNVVDVSNYVMLELSQPNHAYDLATLGGGALRIRRARDGETMVTLDDVERRFAPSDLLICDGTDRAIGIAGIMGGADTEISEATTEIALEMAWFEPIGIASSVARLGLRSEASARFERGVDPYGIEPAVTRFAELLRETCPDLVVHAGWTDARAASLPAERRETWVCVPRVNELLGTHLSADDMVALLDPIGFDAVAGPSEGVLTVGLPSWRPDCELEVDVAEEVARTYGYERIGKTVPKSTVHGRLSRVQARRRLLRDVLAGAGVSEAMPNPFLAPGDIERAGLDASVAVAIANPLVTEESVLRPSLRPGLLTAIAYNESHRVLGAQLYEVGHVYPRGTGQLPDEREELCVVLAGAEAPDAVALWLELSAALGVGAQIDQRDDVPGMHPTRTAWLRRGRQVLGVVGEIDPGVLETFGVTERVACVEVDLSAVLAEDPKPVQARPVSRYPSSDIDLAFVAPDALPAANVQRALRQAGGALLVDLSLFDVYRGPGVPDGSRSLAYRLRLQAGDRTLTDAEVADVRTKCIAAAEKAGATLR